MLKVFRVIRILGLWWVLFRIRYALKLRLGWFVRRLPIRAWEDLSDEEVFSRAVFPGIGAQDYAAWKLKHLSPFLFRRKDFEAWKPWFERRGSEKLDREVENLKSGIFSYFENQENDCGFPPNWHRNSFSGKEIPSNQHWSRLSDFGFGDIKLVWEPSRFGFVFPLVRKYARTGDEQLAEIFWTLFEDWCRKNSPQAGANWKCGQEVSLRLMAWCFAFYAFEGAKATTPERVAFFARAVYESARRVECNLSYALSQKNNHGVSECVGLMTAGMLFPELKGSKRWLALGKKQLESQILELVYPDGGFSQHSLNYHRVMLQDTIFALRLAELNGVRVSEALRERVVRATEYARDFVFGENGDTPCWGANDGAHVFRLSECDYRDFRPHVQSAGIGLKQMRYFVPGEWDEEALWFLGKSALERAEERGAWRSGFSAEIAGTHICRSGDTSVFFRCGRFIHRPGHDDLLHVDIWRKGICIVGDSGSFSYNSSIPFVGQHNTVIVDGLPQMQKLSRFLKAPAQGRLLKKTDNAWEGTHNGYERLVTPVEHRRKVDIAEEQVEVFDVLESAVEHEYTLMWTFPHCRLSNASKGGEIEFIILNAENECGRLTVAVEGGRLKEVQIVEGDEASGEGFVSTYYNEREVARVLKLKFTGKTIRIKTLFSF